MSEQVDIVDEEDNIIGQASLDQTIKEKLLHRGANVMVFNSKCQIFVHKRTDNLKLYPGM